MVIPQPVLYHAGSGSIPVKAKPAQASPLHSHTSLSSLQRANSTSHKSAAQTSTPQSKARPAISSSLQRTGSSNTASSAVQSPKLQPTASLKSANSLQRSSSGNNSPRNPYLQGAPQKATALQRKGSSNGPLRKGPATVSSTAATDSMRSPASTPPHVSTDGASSNCSVSVSQSRNQITEHRSMTGQTDAAVAEILDMPIVRHQVC